MAFAASCSDLDDEIKSSSYDRLFSNCRGGRVQNKTNVRLGWTKVLGAGSYVIELFANDSLRFEGSPVTTYNEVTDNPYTITGLDGETKYSARIKAVGEKDIRI
ncbi:MAG: fibronectin type III domain-containing protein [Bacteroides cellulosilyticus]